MKRTVPTTLLFAFLASILILAGCEPKPQAIHYGSDPCDYCRMIIADPEFAAQVLNPQGRAFKFDSIECMAAFVISSEPADDIHSMWVPDFLNRENWLNAETAVYLHSETLRSPMGLYLSAYAGVAAAEEMRRDYGGEIIGLDDVIDLVRREWLSGDGGGRYQHH